MKRDCERRCGDASPPRKRLASTLVSLNVGGKRFDTTQETLRKAGYFHLYLTGSRFLLNKSHRPRFIFFYPFPLSMSSPSQINSL